LGSYPQTLSWVGKAFPGEKLLVKLEPLKQYHCNGHSMVTIAVILFNNNRE
jgi:hypothetical protein